MSTEVPHERPPLQRPDDGRWLGGVAVGVADHLTVPAVWVRVAFVALAAVNGVGVAAYLFLWATVQTSSQHRPARRSETRTQWTVLATVGAALAAGALVLGFSGTSWHTQASVTLPAMAIVLGAVFVWVQLDDATRRRWLPGSGAARRWAYARLVGGILLVIAGVLALGLRRRSWAEVGESSVYIVVVLVGVGVLLLPWWTRLLQTLRQEQAERIRATERADIAAHLHDSVLQTLALIQRRPDDPQTVARLARSQERQLRSYLYEDPSRAHEMLAGALQAAIDEVEDLHGVPVSLVVTGDTPYTESVSPLVKAVREATWNAVRHAEPPVSVYVEIGSDLVEAFVRDRGAGFDLATVPDDRAGVRESIIGRMERHGGTARIRALEDGTEVVLTLPLTSLPPEETP